ncbi:MAG TPA: hypothetical protein VHM24_11570, partial [Gemmatimonadaceae bacterium]|nr:hypothetical protein [Gemmatimonadaceae bacterium]
MPTDCTVATCALRARVGIKKWATALIVLSTVVGTACTESVSTTEASDAPLTLAVSVTDAAPEGAEAIYTADLAATVRDSRDRPLEDALVTWYVRWEGLAPDGLQQPAYLRPTGPRSAKVVFLAEGSASVSVTAVVGDRKAAATIRVGSKAPRSTPGSPGMMMVWQPDGSITRIPAPSDAAEIYPQAINDRGEIVGSIRRGISGQLRPFYWSPKSGYIFIPIPAGGREAVVTDINDSGIAVGAVWLSDAISRGFMWSPMDGVVMLPDNGALQTIATSINRAGHIAGMRNRSPFIWTAEDGFTAIDGMSSAPASDAMESEWGVALNDRDEVLTSWNGKYDEHVDYDWWIDSYASVWSKGARTNLSCSRCLVSALGERGEVVGATWPAVRAFRWTESSGMEMLATPPGFQSHAMAINT